MAKVHVNLLPCQSSLLKLIGKLKRNQFIVNKNKYYIEVVNNFGTILHIISFLR